MAKKSIKVAAGQQGTELRGEEGVTTRANFAEKPFVSGILDFLGLVFGVWNSDSDNVRLREALVAFAAAHRESDVESCQKLISKRAHFTYQARKRALWVLAGFRLVSYWGIVSASGFSAFVLLNYQHENRYNYLLDVLLAAVMAAIIVLIIVNWMEQAYAYRWLSRERSKRISGCAALDDKECGLIDEFVSNLEKEQGVEVYYKSSFLKRRRVLDRRTFRGDLCYLLFSEDKRVRRLVPQYGISLACPADLYIGRTDLKQMLERPKQAQRGGLGRISSGHFEAALISAVLNGEPNTMPKLSRRYATLREIHAQLTKWYDKTANQSGNVPKADEVRRKSIGVYRGLLRLAKMERERKRTSNK